ncbi:RibD family protein [Clostridium transplantifaecale]|uniref:RibD family protein n=1 Tax=Clostridium transplantifaecale TaxID=2479838 RepID=UPI000F63A70C|nr:dihydrofolate reductase family protein [Clostridium transplantifaecale]
MKKPYIICHMMAAIDGRIDCGMTAKLEGVEEYYEVLNQLNVPTTVSGKVTAKLEMAKPGEFVPQNGESLGMEKVSKKREAAGYEIIVDTRGTLLWEDDTNHEKPLLIITSEQVTKEYLAYLDSLDISWIACGQTKIDLQRASEILADVFGVQRMAIVGGGAINAGFLDAGLLDEVSILFAPGIDGRGGMAAIFDGLPMDREPFAVKLESVTPYDDGVVWLRYLVKCNSSDGASS